MCASYCSLLLIILTSSIWLVTEGLPLKRQERGANQDIIAGADFLSVLIDSTAVEQKRLDSQSTTLRTISSSMARLSSRKPLKLFTRESQNPKSTPTVEHFSQTKLSSNNNNNPKHFTISDNTKYKPEQNITKEGSAINKVNSSLVVSVHVSSSVGDSHINKISPDLKVTQESINSSKIEVTSKSSQHEENAVASEEYTSLISEANKNEFSVDERDPITSGTENDERTEEYPANVQTISNHKFKDKLEPFGHHSVIYHDQPAELTRGRSVSYSTVIQSVPKTHTSQINIKESADKWKETGQNERQNRNFDLTNGPNENDYLGINKNYKSDFQTANGNKKPQEESSSVAETNDYFVTARYESAQNYHKHFPNNKQLNWKTSDVPFNSEATPRKTTLSTEKYWEVIDKPRDQPQPYMRTIADQKRRFPIIYGKPEQNYEVDESVSVMSNGRVHGVQGSKIQLSPPQLDGKIDPNNDNQKVGYVVEGRNYRKYRVEERTSDGFIVGEYGVVSHDDGSLRGVRYTADGTTNPRLIYDALMKFLSL